MKGKRRKIALIFLALLMVFSILSSMAISQNTTTATEEDLNLDIAPKTFKEPKMESVIAQIVNVSERKPAEVQNFATTHKINIVDEKIRVVLELTDEKVSLDGYAIEIEATYKNLVQALVPTSAIKELAKDTAVQYIRLPLRPCPAAIMSEGVEVIGADKVHAEGIKGDAVKIAVIDLGFAGYTTNPEIPLANIVEAMSFRADADIEAGESHGAACTEVVVDVAPNASLYLYNFDTDVEFGNAVNYAIVQGVDIITCSIGWVNAGGYDGTGSICDIVNNAHANGILFVESAGNYANRHYEGTYTDTDTDNLHEFGPGDEILTLGTKPAGSPITLFLSWDDWPISNQDYDLYLLRKIDGDWYEVANSTNWQTGTQPPTEAIVDETTVEAYWGVGIAKYSATRDVHFELYSFTNNFPEYNVKSSSLCIPADAAGAMAAGATYWSDDSLESFSSRGPTNDGRTKPDVTAPDGVSTYVYGNGNFYGTSPPAPHTAGAAALLLSANSSLTADQLQFCLESTAVDLGAMEKDNLYGSGRIDVWSAYQEIAEEYPDIWVEPTSFELTLLQNTSEDYTLKIGNDGNATLTYNITDNSLWLDENPKSGSVEPGSRDNITVSINATGLSMGDYSANINITSNDPDESVITVPVHLTVKPVTLIFDTEQPKNPYPSIFGTHNGTITPNVTICNVSQLYTYPCPGTGGHSEYVAFYNATTGKEIANGTWNGYQGAGDYHYIELNVPFDLQATVTYNYTIRTGSYPQIHHTDALPTANGWINCTEFIDANGKRYDDWIPAIRLE
jgi:hypothetical protein